MKKNLVLLVLLILAVVCSSSCTSNGTISPSEGFEHEQTTNSPSAVVPTEDSEHEQLTTSPEEIEPTSESTPTSAPTNTLTTGDWQAAYAEVLREVDTFNYIERDFIVPGNFSIPPVFYIYDIDKSGIPELILICDDGNWEDASCNIYTFKDDAAIIIGSVKWYWFGSIAAVADSAVGLYSDDSYKGHSGSLYRYTIENDAIIEQLVCEYDFRPGLGEKAFAHFYDENGNILKTITDDETGYAENAPEIRELLFRKWFEFYQITEENIALAAIEWIEVESDVFTTTKRIHESMPEFTFYHIVGNIEPEPWYGEFPSPRAINIIIMDDEGRVIQTISNLTQSIYDWELELDDKKLVFDDFNFDGYLDMRLLRWQEGAYQLNATEYYWLWDIETSQFVLNEQLMELAFSSLSANKETQQVKTWLRLSSACGNTSIYEYHDGRFVFISSEHTLHNTEHPCEHVLTGVYE